MYPVNDARVYPVGFTPLNPGKAAILVVAVVAVAAAGAADLDRRFHSSRINC